MIVGERGFPLLKPIRRKQHTEQKILSSVFFREEKCTSALEVKNWKLIRNWTSCRRTEQEEPRKKVDHLGRIMVRKNTFSSSTPCHSLTQLPRIGASGASSKGELLLLLNNALGRDCWSGLKARLQGMSESDHRRCRSSLYIHRDEPRERVCTCSSCCRCVLGRIRRSIWESTHMVVEQVARISFVPVTSQLYQSTEETSDLTGIGNIPPRFSRLVQDFNRLIFKKNLSKTW